MSRRHCKPMDCKPVYMPQTMDRNCICDFPTLIILILIVLQFSKQGKKSGYDRDDDYDDCDKKCGKDNDIIGNGYCSLWHCSSYPALAVEEADVNVQRRGLGPLLLLLHSFWLFFFLPVITLTGHLKHIYHNLYT